jgi:uncharacterized protein (TIGR02246 family)
MEQPDRQRIEQLVRDLNATWLAGRVDELVRFFHESVVMVPPRGGPRTVGREAMLESFRRYLAAARTHAFDELGLEVDVVGDTAVATLRFAVTYEVQGEVHSEQGIDLLVLALAGDPAERRWRIVWRTQLPA